MQIDVAPVMGDPEATIRKMDIVIRAALAPAEPSAQDRAVARQAQAQRSEAQTELLTQRAEERKGTQGGNEEGGSTSASPLQAAAERASDAYRAARESAAKDIFGAIIEAAA